MIKRKLKLILGAIKTYRNWPTWLLFKFHFFNDAKERVIVLRNGLKFITRFDFNEPGTIDDVLIRGEYFTGNNEISDGDTIIDIGANIGAFSIVSAKKAKNVKVLSFEPTPTTFLRLKKNIEVNNLTSVVKPYNLAVAGEKGERKLFVNPNISGANTIAPYRENLEFIKSGDKFTVKTTTLEDVFRDNKIQKCGFLKMDCEGSEFEITKNTSKEIFDRIDYIAMEYHKNPYEIGEKLTKVGFKVVVKPVDEISGFLYADKNVG